MLTYNIYTFISNIYNQFGKLFNLNNFSLKKYKIASITSLVMLSVMLLLFGLVPIHHAKDYTEGTTNDFTDTTIEGTVGQSTNIAANGVETSGNILSGGFAPGMSKFLAWFGVDYSDNILIKNFFKESFDSSTDYDDNVIFDAVKIFGVVAYSIATALFIIGLVRSGTVSAFEKAASPKEVVFKYVKTIILITSSEALLDPVVLMFEKFFNYMASVDTHGMGTVIVEFIFETVIAGAIAGEAGIIIFLLLKLILLYIVVKEFIKLIVEVVERYMLSCFLYLFAPIGFSFSASSLTENVTISYLEMFISSLFVLILNQFFVKSTLELMAHVNNEEKEIVGITCAIIVLAWIRIGQHIDETLKGMGLSIARTGGNLFDSFAASVNNAISLANTGGALAGNAVTAVGMTGGNPDAVQLGSMLNGKPMTTSQAEDKIMNTSFEGGKNMPVRKAQVENFFDGISNNTADRQFSIKQNEYMTTAFGSNWQEKIAGKGGFVDASRMRKMPDGTIHGYGTDVDGNAFEFSLAKNGQNLSNGTAFASTKTNGTDWQIQYSKHGGFGSMNSHTKFEGEQGVKNFMKRAGMNTEQFKKLTGYTPSEVHSIDMENGSARLQTARGTVGAIHEIDGKYRFSDAARASGFGTKGIDRSAELTAGSSAMQRERIDTVLENAGIEKPEKPSNWKHRSDFVNPDTGVINDAYIDVAGGAAYFEKDTGIVYSIIDSNGSLAADPLYTEAYTGEYQYDKQIGSSAEKIIHDFKNSEQASNIGQDVLDNMKVTNSHSKAEWATLNASEKIEAYKNDFGRYNEGYSIKKPEKPSSWKHRSDFVNPDTGAVNNAYIDVAGGAAYYEKDTGIVYSIIDSNGSLAADPLYTEAYTGENPVDTYEYDEQIGSSAEKIVHDFKNSEQASSIDQDILDNMEVTNSHSKTEWATLNASEKIEAYENDFGRYNDAYSSVENKLRDNTNQMLINELTNKENLSSVDEIDANERKIYATSKDKGKVAYSYRYVFDQGPDRNEKIIGGTGSGQNMLAYKPINIKRVDNNRVV
ncbi:MAG: hypothetical protein K6E51_12860 [Treponema sp.]|nr:hypothetical protein [Treponema sp.]